MTETKPDEPKTHGGAVPPAAITALSWELHGLTHGTATLEIHVRDGRLARFATGRTRSHLGDDNAG